MAAFEAPNPLSPGDVMVGGHLLQPGRSASIQHVDVFGVQLAGIKKNYEVPSSGKEVGFKLHLAAPIVGDEDDREDLARAEL
jgi:hypothetical protein